MTVALAAFPQFLDNAGALLSGGKLYTYAAGTTTPLASYTDQDGLTPNANPVILDSAGRADVWLTANVAYKLVLKTSADVTLETVDEYYAGASPEQLTAAGIVPATGGTYTGLVSFTGGATFDGTQTQDTATLNSLGIAGVETHNLWINSDFSIAQRTVGSVAVDGTYGFDRTVALSQTASTGLSQLTAPTDGIPYAMRITQNQAAAQRIGFHQPVEFRNCVAYRGAQLVFVPKVRCSVSTNIRAALVAWTSTADAPTRDVINTWTSTNYTASNFFIANTSTIATAAVSVSANTWTDIPVSSVSAGGVVAPSTMNNLYLVVWSEATLAQNVTLDASVMRAGAGTSIPVWTPPIYGLELLKCQRYWQKSYAQGTAPGAGELTGNIGHGYAIDTSTALILSHFLIEMRIAPVISTYQPSTGTGANVRTSASGASVPISGPTAISTRGIGLTYTSSAAFTSGGFIDFHWTADAEL